MLLIKKAHAVNTKSTFSGSTMQHDAVKGISTPPRALEAGIYDIEKERVTVSFYNLQAHFYDSPIYSVAIFAGAKNVK